ncbi:tandem-95 repeat protein, partial [Vibrio astriarenae]
SVNEDGEITLSQEQLLSQASDVEGDDLTASNLSVDGNAEVTVNDDGSFTITPDADWNGDIDISFDISDGANVVQAQADLTVNPVNDLPQPQDQEFTVEEDGTLTFTDADLLAGATDIEGDDLSVEGISYTGTDGILSDNGDGTYSFAPNDNFNGDVEFTFDVSDGTDTVTANVDVSVTPVDDAPVSGDLAYSVNEDGEITLSQEQLLSQASDVEGDDLTASNLSVDGNAEVTVNDDGSFTITPDADWNGDIDISFDISDGANVVQAQADLTVNPVNDLPQPHDQEFTVEEDGTLTFTDADLLTGATDIDGDDLSVEGISYTGTDGILTDNGNGTYSFAPNENFNGDVEFTFDVSDGTDTVTANVDVSVTPVDDAPTVEGNLSYTVNEDGEITLSQEQLLSNVSDVEGDDLTASNLSVDGNAEVTVNDDGSFTITPDADWNGDIDISFDVSDGENIVASGAVLTVNPVNDLPQPQDQEFTIQEDGILTFTDAHLLQGATDIEGDNLTVEGISYEGTDGILTDNGNGTYSFAPNENFNGDVEFTFDVSDGTDTVTANIDVSVTPVDDAPTVEGNLAYTVNEDGEIILSQEQLLSNVSDVDGDDLTASNLSVDGNAEVTVNDDGSFTITPDADWNGDIDISFDVSDGENIVASGADLTVNPVNDLPQPQDQEFTIQEDGILTFTDAHLLQGATDIEGDNLTVEGISYEGTDGILTDNGNGTYSFAPNENFNGDVEFTFDVSDGTDTVTANIDVSVTPVDDAPTVEGNLAYTVNEDGEITLSQEQLLSNVSDVDGDDLTVSNLSVDGNAEVTVNDDGSFTITPDADWNGDIDISFDVSDGENIVASGADLTVNPVNDLPQPQDQEFTIQEDGILTFTDAHLLQGATDIEGDNLTVEGISYEGTDGILTDNGNGTYSFAPNENFNGDVEFTFDVSDGTDTVTANIDVSVTPVDDAPTVEGNLAYTVNEDGEITLSQEQLLSNVSDVDGDDLTVSNLSVDGNAEVTVNDDGSFTITPDADWNGDIDISFDVSDGENIVASGADLTVNPVNDLPQPQDQEFTIQEDGILTFTDAHLLQGATDIEGDNLTVEGISYEGTDGILTDNGNGTYSFAPNENFNGDVEFTFDVSDGTDTVTANIDVSVTPVDDAPTVEGNLSYTVNEDGEITLSQEQLLSNVSDVEGDNLTALNLAVDGNAEVSVNDDGSFTITPDADWNGDIDISFDVSDGENIVASGADLTVNPVNDLPQPQDQEFTIQEDGILTFTDAHLLQGATDIEGDNLTVEGISYEGTDGILTDNGNGTYSFAPNENFNGDVEFTFDVSDGTDTVTANVDVSVTPMDDAPVSGDLAYSVNEDGVITLSQEQLLSQASDAEGDDLTASNLSVDGNAEVTANDDGSFTIIPDADWNGDIDISFDISDGNNVVQAQADLTVNPVNDLPQPEDKAYTVEEDGTLTFTDDQLLENATDIDGDELSIEGVSYTGTDGVLTDNGNGTYSFAPNENFSGDVEFSFDVSDGTDTVTASIDVQVTEVNDPPVAGPTSYTINEDSVLTFSESQVLANATDVDGEVKLVGISYDGPDGIFSVNGDGTCSFAPNENFNGEVQLNVTITDDDGATVDTVINVDVLPTNDAPVSGSTAYQVDEDGSITISQQQLLSQASDVEGDDLTASNLTVDGNAEVVANDDGSFTITPDADWNGDIDLAFDITDGTDTIQATADLTVNPVNDLPQPQDHEFTMQEDGILTFTDEQLLENATDIDGDDLSVEGVSYSGTDGILTDNGDGTYSFAPNENFNGDVEFTFDVSDGTDTVTANVDVNVTPVDDAPTVDGSLAYTIDEDGQITLSQDQLLTHASDVEGDTLTAQNLSVDGNATVTANEDGSFTITPDADWNGDIDISFDVTDGNNVVQGTADLTVNPVNDAPDAGDEIFIQAEEDQTVGVTLREEPSIRLDQAPEHGIIEANLNDEWVELEVGIEIPADTEVRFVANEDDVAAGTHTTQVGTFDDNASVDDWGTEVDPYTREFVDGDLTVTVQSNDDPLGAWNGNTHIGHGIGDTDRQGLSGDEKLTVTVEGQDINEISFHLDGLGGWFMEESRHFTEVEIKAFNADGDVIDSMTYHKEDRGSYETDYTLTVDEPVSYFELGTIQGNGTYVVQNMTVSQTCPDEAVFTSIGVDGSEITETVNLQIREGDSEIDLTAELPNIEIDTEGATQFASVVITEEQLLAQATDIDSEDLDIQNLELVGDNAENATLTDNGDGTWTVTPDENFHGEIELGYQVTDGELTDDNIININFESVNDAPIVSGPIVLSTDEDVGITFIAEDLLANASDVEGDELSITDITYNGDNGELIDNGDGSYTFMPNENFNGEVDIDYSVFDGQDTTETHLDLTVIPVNDVPVPGEPLHTQMLENGTIVIEAKDLLAGATDVDGDILHIENLLLVDQTQGTLTDNGDNTFTFEPSTDFHGDVNLTFDISDGIASAPSTASIDVETVNEGPDVTGPVDAVVDEDGTITITQEELLENASDVDGDDLEAINLQTNDPNATIVENEDGSFTITPSENFFGEIEFTYDVTDAIETVSTGLNLTVNPVNDLPDVPDLSFTTEDGESITLTQDQLLAQATDIEGDDLTAVNVTSLNDNVEVVDNGDGTFTLTTEEGYFGNADLTFDVSDGTDTVTANIDLTVEFVNDAPEAEAVAATVEEDGSILVTQEMLLENAHDVDGDDLYATGLSTNDPNATVVDNGDGTFTVTPSEDFNGQIQFDYEVNDGELSTTTQLNLDVTPVNDAPEVEGLAFEMQEDGTLLITDEQLLENATDIDGDTLSVSDVSYTGEQGELVDNGDGTYSFTPGEHFSGDLQLGFTVSDGEAEVSQTLDVHVEAVADAPDLVVTDGEGEEVGDSTIVTEPGGTVELNIGASLVDQDLSETLTVEVDGIPEGTVVRYDNESVLNDQDNGITSFNDTEITVTFEGETAGFQNAAGYYKVDEDGNITGVEVVYENASQVGGGGDLLPGQSSFTFPIEEGESFNLFLIPNGFNHNDFDAMQNGSFEFRDVNGEPATMDTVDPQLVFVGEDGEVTVVQGQFDDAVFHGGSSSDLNQDGIEHTRTTINEDGELVYGFEDLYGGGDADYTDFNFTIDVGEVNSQIYSGEVTVGEDGSVVIPTTAIDQTIEFVLPEDAQETFDITVSATATELSNDDAETVSQTITIDIEHAPEADAVSAQVDEDGSIIITQEDLLANATDLDGDDLTALNLSTDDENVTITDNGDGTYTLTPDADFNGDIEFTFDVSDGDQIVSTDLNLTVNPVNDGPVAEDKAYKVEEDGSLTFTDEQLLENATDIEGDELTVEGVSYTGTDGVLSDNGDGTYTFAPNENFSGDVDFTFNVSDGTDTVTANIDVQVTEVNDPPVAGPTSYTINEDSVLTFSESQVLANASDVDGEVELVGISYDGPDGIFSVNGDGTCSFAPNENFNGEVQLNVVITDDDGATVETVINVDVLPINDAPVSGSTAYTVDEDGSITISQEQLLSQSSDVEGDDLNASNLTVDGNAEVTVNDDGSFTITPDADFNGDIDMHFDITDGTNIIQATADLTVNPVNDLPTVGAPTFTAQEDTSFTFTEEQLLQGAGDIDGDSLTVENVASDSGTLVDNGDGTYTFAPNENFDGNVNVTFDVNDGTASVPAEATIDVQSVVDMPELAIASDLVLASDNFESGSNGWNAGTESSQGFESGDMLGRIGGTGGEEAVSKTYDIPSDVNEVNISFSFYEIDSWDGESFQIFVGGEPLASLDNSAFRTQDGTTTLYDSEGNEVGQVVHGASQQEGFSGWNDQEHQVTLTVPVEDGQLQLGFGSTLNQSVPDESFGIDNIEITVADADYQIIGTEDEPVALDIDAALTDTDGSENLSILIEDVPEGSSLSAGIDNGDGTWSLSPEELAGLEFTPAADFNGDVTLVVNATSTDVDTGTTATATQDVTIHISPANDAPEVSDGVTAVTAEDNSITITQEQLLVNATDIDGDDLSAINLQTDDPNATIEMNEDGSFTITPSDDFYGDINFTYDVTDGEEVVATSLDLSVTPVNDAPVPEDKAYSVEEDGSLTFTDAQLLAGATDIEGDALTVEGVNYSGNDGILTDNGDGTYTFAPNENFSGDVDLTFNVSDGTDTVTANIDVQVIEVNDPPVAGHTAYTVQEDNSITISDEQLLAKASDLEGDVAIDSVNYTGTDGVFADNGDGTYTFSPNENFTGDISLDVTVIDEDGATADTTAGITVIEVNDPPVAGDTAYSVNEDEVLTFSAEQLLAQSSDIEGEVALESVGYSGSDGILTDNGDGTFSFAPNANFNGDVALDVVVVDEDGATDTAIASIDVLPINDAPVSGSTSYQVNEDGSITISQEQLLANTTDIEGDDLTASNLTVDGNAEVTANDDGSFTITPDADWNGDIDLSFDVTDGTDTVQGKADLTVNPVNDLPQPEDKSYTVEEDGTLTFTDAQLLENATDIDGDTLSIDGVSYTGTDGILTDNGDGTYSFAPNENFSGDVELSFGVSDGTETVQASIDVQVTEVNDPPVAGHTAYTIQEDNSITISDEQLLANSSDVEGEVAIDAVNYTGTDGVFTDNGDGTYTFSPNENFTGDISLDVTVTDEDGATADTTAGITVIEVNDPPVAGDTAYSVNEDEVLTFSAEQLLAQSSDIEGEVALESVSYSGSDGILTDNGDGTFSFAPNANFNGDVALDVVVVDEDGATDTATASIDVLPINDPPVSNNLAYSVSEDGSITLSQEQLLAQASDIDSTDLEALNLTAAGNATVVENQDGSFTITPDADFNGQIDLQFDLIDNDGASVQVGVDLTVDPANDVPVAGSTEFTELEDTVMRITPEELLANASDIDGDDLTVLNVQYTGDDGSIADTGSIQFGADGSGEIQVTDQLEEHDEFTVQFGYTSTGEHDGNVESILLGGEDGSGLSIYVRNEDGGLGLDLNGQDNVMFDGVDLNDGGEHNITLTWSSEEGIVNVYDNGELVASESVEAGIIMPEGIQPTIGQATDVLDGQSGLENLELSGFTMAYEKVDEEAIINGTPLGELSDDLALDIQVQNGEIVDVSGSVDLEVSGAADVDRYFEFTPAENFNGDVTLDYQVTDGIEVVDTSANLEFIPVNDAPESDNIDVQGTEDTTILITQDMLLAKATDVDNTQDELSAIGLRIDEQFGELIDNQDGTWSFTPAENFNGDVPMEFEVSDGELTTTVSGNIDVAPVNDAPDAPTFQMQGEEDQVMVIDPSFITNQITDLDGDEISLENISVRAPANATITQQPDGMYHLVTAQDFNGLVELGYTVTDGTESVDGSLNVDVIPVNDAPFSTGNAMMATDEDGAFTFDAGDLMNLFDDIDTENLVVSRIITPEGEDGGDITDNGDGTWTFTPTEDFAGLADLQVIVSDGEFETALDVPVYVRPVADGAVITTEHDGPLVIGEDSTGHLGLNVDLIDDSETLSNLVMTGFPVGFEVSDGVNTIIITSPDQYIDITEWNMGDLQITPPQDFTGSFNVTVSATTVDYGDEPEAFEDGIDSGDFETVAGESVILTADDLMAIAENVDVDAGDEVKFVHLTDRSQGEIVDNGDGTWTFNPAPGFTGEVDIAYVIDKDGVLHDEQTGVVVNEPGEPANEAPQVESVVTTDLEPGATLEFTDADMLANLSDAENDALSIESVSLMEGQGMIETDNAGNYQFTPAEGYVGPVEVGFIATDGENRIESQFNVNLQGSSEVSEEYVQGQDGSIVFAEEQILNELDLSPSAEVLDVADAGDVGFFVESGNNEWTFWPNDDFNGEVPMKVEVNDNGLVEQHDLTVTAQTEEVGESQSASSQEQVSVESQPEQSSAQGDDPVQQEASDQESEADVTAAPGDTINIAVPDDVAQVEGVDHVEMSGLPEGSTVSGALDSGDGNYTISGDLSQPVSVELPEGFEGNVDVGFQGYDELGSQVDEAQASVTVEVDDQHAMSANQNQDGNTQVDSSDGSGGDWTTSGGQEAGVDFNDDSGSFDNDHSDGGNYENDFDNNSF